ncbi:protein PRY1-like isoform X1 [Acyrthosiphon pisum]|uniref:SCP domain-containing protein n=1 Tax=Acyrthosiphon pisum TaxID=7029 RepID=A0A8R2B545_ACYPI|nr:protein PRY1-like isoform X1 [Acyrthosiphon pisum]XP_016659271.1 protein PRY1-like isoform X1 [Acyrthosiphon pisum]XP_029345232.1 protein PRY1-like isoform X1 [Acyrthosiphon pisum]|eukprot:XP_008182305.1 PREDICTED: protein PRY1-like isoform X1 [Acyrthosiphon pisum]
MNIRGAAGGGGSGDGSGSPSDAGYSAALVDVGRKMLAMDGLRLRPIRTTGPSPVAHNGRYWTPDRRRENAETVRYIRCLVQTCEAIKPWTAAGYQTSSTPQTRTKVTMDQLPRIMQKVLGNKIRSNRDHKFVNYWTPSDFVKNCLFWHNFYRHFHRSSDLVLSPHLCVEAQNWANHLAHTETFAYQNKINYGQNLFCRKPTNTEIEGKDVVREWYSSSRVYKPRKNPKMYSANINSGPFTQLVWSNTKELGVGKACSRSGRIIVVANYLPKGNVNGQYANNVHMNQYFLPANKKKLEFITRQGE